jgi:hypothetical protein
MDGAFPTPSEGELGAIQAACIQVKPSVAGLFPGAFRITSMMTLLVQCTNLPLPLRYNRKIARRAEEN